MVVNNGGETAASFLNVHLADVIIIMGPASFQ